MLEDNIDTTDMPTTAGSQTLADDLPTEEAFSVTALRDSGALILAKGNMDEWAHGGGELRDSRHRGAHADVFAAAQEPDSLMDPAILARLKRESTRGTLEDPDSLAAVDYAPTTMRAGIDRMLDENDVDALVHTSASAMANFSGYPSVLAHADVASDGDPVAIQGRCIATFATGGVSVR